MLKCVLSYYKSYALQKKSKFQSKFYIICLCQKVIKSMYCVLIKKKVKEFILFLLGSTWEYVFDLLFFYIDQTFQMNVSISKKILYDISISSV